VVFRHLTSDVTLDPTPGPGVCANRVDLSRDLDVGTVVATYLVAPKTSPPRRA
jgi:hypothetical protein